jgi:RNA polymerase sigma factor (sigma-70 family)
MAFACAFAVLGDVYLAQDTAQEAFVVAWQKLAQLREPAAFPGWFKRIVLSQCNRLTRCKRLQLVPLEEEINASIIDLGPHASAERRDLVGKVMHAINELPENERLVTTLFYVNGYTQADIGDFLEVPVSTVNKRLYSARQRLKSNVVDLFKSDLQQRRPSRDAKFSNEVSTKLRPFHDPDWDTVSAIASARAGDDAPGHALWLRHRQKFDESRYFRRHYVVENAEAKQIVAYGAVEQTIYLPKYRLLLLTDPQWLKRGVGDLLLDRLSEDLHEAQAVTVSCRQHASETELVQLFERRGFVETSRVLDLRLDVADADVSVLAAVLQRLGAAGISISTLAEERVRDPHCVEKLHELTTLLSRDDPAQGPFAPPAYNAREALLWLEMPYVLPDAYFIAKHGDDYIGVSDVSRFEAVPGGLTQGFIGVKREYRRRGLATALQLQGIVYARSNDYQLIQSSIKPQQIAIHGLNEKLGFQLLSENLTLEKCLTPVAAVAAECYEEFAGQYRDDSQPDLELTVRNESGRLTIECVGQKVELFPTSETSYFIKQFYGEVSFHRNEEGKVDYLDFAMRGVDKIMRAFAFVLILTFLGVLSTARAQTAEQKFKNIQIFKGLPAAQLDPTMAFISGSLGVRCNYCHVTSSFDKDEKQTKLTARRMIQMVFDLNKGSFNGQGAVSCYTCHRGKPTPVSVPAVGQNLWVPSSPSPSPEALPPVKQILDRYVQAVGGPDVLTKITSRVAKGSRIGADGVLVPEEVYQKAPDKLLTVTSYPNVVFTNGYNGTAAWAHSSRDGLTPLPDQLVAQLKRDAVFYKELKTQELYSNLMVLGRALVRDADAYLIQAKPVDGPVEKLFFDARTGLLVRRYTESDTPLGKLPLQVDYEDYREVDGAKQPFLIHWSFPGRIWGRKIDEIKQNIPLDDAKFNPIPPRP